MLIKIDAAETSPAQTLSTAFELTGDEHRGRLRLLSPIGTQLAEAQWAPDGVSLVTGEGRRQFNDLNALARDALGETVPLGALTHWLAARPWPAAPFTTTTQGFDQLGWAIDLSRWAQDATVEARRAQAPAVLVRARLDR
jgi:outer membrane lipoprotein LolB